MPIDPMDLSLKTYLRRLAHDMNSVVALPSGTLVPEGWDEAIDVKTNQYYYYNKYTGESSWSPPSVENLINKLQTNDPKQLESEKIRDSPILSGAELPLNWQEAFDTTTMKIYYYNTITNETSWTLPSLVNLEHEAEQWKALHKQGELCESQGDWSEYWIEKESKSLFYNSSTHVYQWNQPVEWEETISEDENDSGDEIENKNDDSQEKQLKEATETVKEEKPIKKKCEKRSRAQILVDFAEVNETDSLDLSGLEASKITSRIWNLESLCTLILKNNKLQRLPSGIQYLSNLTYLDVSNNQLKKLPRDMNQLTHLKFLLTSDNQINYLSVQLWKMRNLIQVNLSHNKLTKLRSCIGDLQLLKETSEWEVGIGLLHLMEKVNLSWNLMVEIPFTIGKCKSLVELNLSNNCITNVTDELYTLELLERLELYQNKLDDIADGIERLSHLKYLDISFNELIKLPEKFFQLQNLNYLNLKNNKINSLPSEFGNLVNLDYLNISSNCLSQLPTSFNNLKLTKLIANHCQLEVFDDLIKLPLQELDISHNHLKEFNSSFFTLAEHLEILNGSFNELEEIPENFSLMRKLRFLDLSHNLLSQLPNLNYQNLKALEILKLSFNYLQELPSMFVKLCNIQVLHLDHNQLVKFPSNFGNLSTLRQFFASHNLLKELFNNIQEMKSLELLDLQWNKFTKYPQVFHNSQFTQKNTFKHLSMCGNPFDDEIDEKVPENCIKRASLDKNDSSEAMNSLLIGDFVTAETLCNKHLNNIPLDYFMNNTLDDLEYGHLFYCRGIARSLKAKKCRVYSTQSIIKAKELLRQIHKLHYVNVILTNKSEEKILKNPNIPSKSVVEILEEIKELEKEWKEKTQFSEIQIQEGRNAAEEALLDLENAIQCCYDVSACHYARGLLFYHLTQYGEAIDEFTKSIELAPSCVVIYLKRAEAYEALGKHLSAIENYTKALEISPKSETILKKKQKCSLVAQDLNIYYLQNYLAKDDENLCFDNISIRHQQMKYEIKKKKEDKRMFEEDQLNKQSQMRTNLCFKSKEFINEIHTNIEMMQEEESKRLYDQEIRAYNLKKRQEQERELQENLQMEQEENAQLFLMNYLQLKSNQKSRKKLLLHEEEDLKKKNLERIARRGGRRNQKIKKSNISKQITKK